MAIKLVDKLIVINISKFNLNKKNLHCYTYGTLYFVVVGFEGSEGCIRYLLMRVVYRVYTFEGYKNTYLLFYVYGY